MDSNAILDYAVFRLTPTRTRCDLVLFCGKTSEKLASGLVEPFVSHLQYAKDQILKGGYSITLRPPSADDYAPWFTKATFQRFVHFVSTPEIIERLMRLEQEILQIESYLQSNVILRIEDASHQGEGSSPVSSDGITKKSTYASKSSADEEDGSALKENSKVQLQHLMDTRKVLLLKEQAMAYARAFVAGYEIDTIDDLLCFADAFGASHLRVACSDLKDLYEKNHSNDQWIDQLAAVQVCPVTDLSYMGTSGILLAGANLHNNTVPLVRTGSSGSDGSKESNLQHEQNSSVHQQFLWMNQMPPYMYGHHMPYFPGYMGFPPPKDHRKHRLSRRKEKNSDSKESESSDDQDERINSSSSGNDSAEEKEHHNKKHSSKGLRHNKNKKKSSKTVVIRNINYITSQMHSGEVEKEDVSDNDDSSEAVSLDEASIREGIDTALASLERHSNKNSSTRKNENHSQWGAFQNLLLSREDSACNNHKPMSVDVDSFDECFVVKGSKIKEHLKADDSVLVIRRNGVKIGVDKSIDFATGEATHLMTKKKIVSEGERALFSNQFEESRSDSVNFSSESTGKISRGGEDLFIDNPSSNLQILNRKQLDLTFDGDFVVEAGANKETATVVDDSFVVGSKRSASVDEHYASQWKTDITTSFDKLVDKSPTNSGPGLSRSVEPDELCMVLARELHESTDSWAPEVDYAAEISFSKVDQKSDNDVAIEANGKSACSGKKSTGPRKPVKEVRSKSISKSKLDSLAKSKNTPASRSMMQKSKSQREEEERKRMEELVIQRQKRIAERTAANNGLSPKKPPKLVMGKHKDTRSMNQTKHHTRLAV